MLKGGIIQDADGAIISADAASEIINIHKDLLDYLKDYDTGLFTMTHNDYLDLPFFIKSALAHYKRIKAENAAGM